MATMAEKAGTKSCQVGKGISSVVLTCSLQVVGVPLVLITLVCLIGAKVLWPALLIFLFLTLYVCIACVCGNYYCRASHYRRTMEEVNSPLENNLVVIETEPQVTTKGWFTGPKSEVRVANSMM